MIKAMLVIYTMSAHGVPSVDTTLFDSLDQCHVAQRAILEGFGYKPGGWFNVFEPGRDGDIESEHISCIPIK